MKRRGKSWRIFSSSSPDFHFEDKVFLEAGRNDRPPILLKYHRRGKKRMTYIMGSVALASNSERVGPTVS